MYCYRVSFNLDVDLEELLSQAVDAGSELKAWAKAADLRERALIACDEIREMLGAFLVDELTGPEIRLGDVSVTLVDAS